MKKLFRFTSVMLMVFLLQACEECEPTEPTDTDRDLTNIPYNPTAFTLQLPSDYPQILIPQDNPFTEQGIALGRLLFYDPILSGDSTQSCSSCHLPVGSFTDNFATSKGIDGFNGRRSAMSLMNSAYSTPLFWDGRVNTLEEQALLPVEDPIEMHATWPQVIGRLKKHATYPEHFRKAFGISKSSEINKELAAKALAQFERTLVGGNSKYDKFKRGEADLTDDEIDGLLMFVEDGSDFGLPDAQCFHCHGTITFTGNGATNNGLQEAATLNDFPDKGYGERTGIPQDNGIFKAPTLQNIALTAPYMHDGRFATLEEVLDHYGNHGKFSPNKNQFIDQIGFPIAGSNPIQYSPLSADHKRKIVAFLHTLTDTSFINKPELQNPF